MKGGNKGEPPDTKLVRGTWRHDRDGSKVQIMTPDDPPMMPDMTPEAEIVWQQQLPRVMATGVVEFDSEFFAAYCHVVAAMRKVHAEGVAAPGSIYTEFRRMSELLGIAGPKSRVGRAPPPKPDGNPFSKRR